MSNNSFMTMTQQLTTKTPFASANSHAVQRNSLVTMQGCLAVATVIVDQAESNVKIMSSFILISTLKN